MLVLLGDADSLSRILTECRRKRLEIEWCLLCFVHLGFFIGDVWLSQVSAVLALGATCCSARFLEALAISIKSSSVCQSVGSAAALSVAFRDTV
jgi:hypothetical protein